MRATRGCPTDWMLKTDFQSIWAENNQSIFINMLKFNLTIAKLTFSVPSQMVLCFAFVAVSNELCIFDRNFLTWHVCVCVLSLTALQLQSQFVAKSTSLNILTYLRLNMNGKESNRKQNETKQKLCMKCVAISNGEKAEQA